MVILAPSASRGVTASGFVGTERARAIAQTRRLAQRSGSRQDGLIASPVPVCVLRPGDSLIFEGERGIVQRGACWPYEGSG